MAVNPAIFASIIGAFCWTFTLVVVGELFAPAASPIFQAVNSAISGGNLSLANLTSANSPQPTSISLAIIPVIASTGPSQCILFYLNGYFMELNVAVLSYYKPPQLDYYVPAKSLIRYFCDPLVATTVPFKSMCTAACINSCQQYNLDAWIQIEGTAVEATLDNDFCVSFARLLRQREIVLFLIARGRISILGIFLMLMRDARLNAGFSFRRGSEKTTKEQKKNG